MKLCNILLFLILNTVLVSAIINLRQFDNSSFSSDATVRIKTTGRTGPVDPVVLVPGIFGSQLYAWYNKTYVPHYICSKDSKGYTIIWLCFQCMVPKVIDCWVENMQLNFTNNEFVNHDNVRTKVNNFGGTEGIECIDSKCYYPYFKAIVESFVAAGYERNVSIRAAPYDFRYGPNTHPGKAYLQNLRRLIEQTYTLNGGRQVSIIAHSMGNLYTMEFFKTVSSKWKNKYIKRYMSISGVFGGSVKSIRALISGETESIPRVLVDGSTVRAFQRSFQSIYWLLPRSRLWNDSEPLVYTENRNYTVDQIDELFRDAKFKTGPALRKSTLDMVDFVDVDVPVYCIHGTDIPTAAGFRWKKGYFPDYEPQQMDGPGDGTVNERSLLECTKFRQLRYHKVYKGVKNGEHMQILLNPDMIRYLLEVILPLPVDKDQHEDEGQFLHF